MQNATLGKPGGEIFSSCLKGLSRFLKPQSGTEEGVLHTLRMGPYVMHELADGEDFVPLTTARPWCGLMICLITALKIQLRSIWDTKFIFS